MPEAIPIETCDDGVIRLRGTRVTLDVLVAAFKEGATAEEIAHQYPSAPLSDVHQTIGYYLRHVAELTPYLDERRRVSRQVQQDNESRWAPDGICERLMARPQWMSCSGVPGLGFVDDL